MSPNPRPLRSRRRRGRWPGLLAALALVLAAVAQPAAAHGGDGGDCEEPETDMRGTWISSVSNIDWPSEPGLDVETQKQELIAFYDEAVDLELNAVFVQVRPTADAFWPSEHEPWSRYLTGTQGEDPGYDPLEFAVEAAHERGLEFHAWFNPYRVTMSGSLDQLVEDHPARQHPEWTFEHGDRVYYNPGVPEARLFVEDAIMDAVENYAIDGVHFDDYFYPYPIEGEEIPDAETYAEHGGDFDDIADWRRNNVDLLVQEMGERIDAVKPDVEFGISPFGIWRNEGTDPEGSATKGLQAYDELYADSRRWVTEEWVDYLAPQVYWQIGNEAADYAALVPWWSEVAQGTDVRLYIGQAAYRVGEEGWEDPAELSNHLTLNDEVGGVHGNIFFSANSLRDPAAEAMQILVEEHYR